MLAPVDALQRGPEAGRVGAEPRVVARECLEQGLSRAISLSNRAMTLSSYSASEWSLATLRPPTSTCCQDDIVVRNCELTVSNRSTSPPTSASARTAP
ncbi:hypothetical protein ACFQV8_26115 [Pseudonocardia benzenivorans]